LKRRLAVAALLLALAAGGVAWGPALWLAVSTVTEPMDRHGIAAINPTDETFRWHELTGEYHVHRWRRDAQGNRLRHGPYWIRWSPDGALYLTGWNKNDNPVRITERSRSGEIVAQARWGERGLEVRTAPPWFEE